MELSDFAIFQSSDAFTEEFSLRESCSETPLSSDKPDLLEDGKIATAGRWTSDEHERFLEGLRLYQKGWKKIAAHIATRSVVQVRTHAQKYFLKMAKLNRNASQASGDEHAMDKTSAPPKKKTSAIKYSGGSVDSLCSSSSRSTADKSFLSLKASTALFPNPFGVTQAIVTNNNTKYSNQPVLLLHGESAIPSSKNESQSISSMASSTGLTIQVSTGQLTSNSSMDSYNGISSLRLMEETTSPTSILDFGVISLDSDCGDLASVIARDSGDVLDDDMSGFAHKEVTVGTANDLADMILAADSVDLEYPILEGLAHHNTTEYLSADLPDYVPNTNLASTYFHDESQLWCRKFTKQQALYPYSALPTAGWTGIASSNSSSVPSDGTSVKQTSTSSSSCKRKWSEVGLDNNYSESHALHNYDLSSEDDLFDDFEFNTSSIKDSCNGSSRGCGLGSSSESDGLYQDSSDLGCAGYLMDEDMDSFLDVSLEEIY